MILYSPPTLWGLLRGAAINLLLPFINGLMLGFGELFAHEAAFRLGWGGTKVWIFSTILVSGRRDMHSRSGRKLCSGRSSSHLAGILGSIILMSSAIVQS
jgi:hypothetical protein